MANLPPNPPLEHLPQVSSVSQLNSNPKLDSVDSELHLLLPHLHSDLKLRLDLGLEGLGSLDLLVSTVWSVFGSEMEADTTVVAPAPASTGFSFGGESSL